MNSEQRAIKRRRSGPRFLGHFLCATFVVIAAALLGVVIEHSAIAQTIAPHSYDSLETQLLFRGGRPYVKDVVTVDGHRSITIRPIPLAKGAHREAGRALKAGPSQSPFDPSSLPELMRNLAAVTAVALVVAGLDRVRRLVTRRRRMLGMPAEP
jgi:hypothetical protein